MSTDAKGWKIRTGWALTGLVTFLLVMSAVIKLVQPAAFMENWAKMGWPASRAPLIAIVEIACAALYAIPRTSVLGAILVAAYFGGATATHVRIADPTFIVPVVLGVLAWAGLWLRDARVRELLPRRR